MTRLLSRTLGAGRTALVLGLLGVGLAGCNVQGLADKAGSLVNAALASVGLGEAPPADGAPGAAAPNGRAVGAGGGARTHLVELATARNDTLNLTSVYNGSLRARRSVRIHAQEEGRVAGVRYYEGDRVEAGALLLELESTLLEAQLDKAVAMRRESEANLARLSGLRQRRLVGEDEYLRAATAVEVARAEEAVLSTRLSYARMLAPFDGVVSERKVEPGDVAARHDHVLTVIDPDSLVIDILASELLLPDLQPGDPVTVRIDALGTDIFQGEVQRIYPEMDPRTRQGRVEVALTPVPAAARAGQFARVTFNVQSAARTIIPFGALRRDPAGEYVFSVDADGKARRTEVRSGRRLADEVEILEGLSADSRVVLRGFLGLSDGMTVTAAPASGSGEG